MYKATVILKKGEGRTLKAGGLWVFDNEIAKIDGEFENGDIVAVLDFDFYGLRLYKYKKQNYRKAFNPQKRRCCR